MTNSPKSKVHQDALAAIAGLNKKPGQLPREFLSPADGPCEIPAPEKLTLNCSLDQVLLFARKIEASDIHLSVNNPIVFRRYGKLCPQATDILSADKLQSLISSTFDKEIVSTFIEKGDAEFVHTIKGAGRYRLTLMKQRLGCDLTARVIPSEIRTLKQSGMPKSCEGLTQWAQGLVLITGPAGSGKTSSLATLIEIVNQSRHDHIITIENPIEIIYESKLCQITQREINRHTLSQANALRAALREDPDILVVSELRDLESIQLAVTAAETGHLVFGTMNTNTASQTISNIINSFPPEDQSIITNMISESLRGIVCQQLIPRVDGKGGLVPAFEVLIIKTSIANLIRTGNLHHIDNAIATGASSGMVLFDNYLEQLVHQKIVTFETAKLHAINPDTFGQMAAMDPAIPGY